MRGPGVDRGARPLGVLSAGSARLALDKMELLLTDKRLVVLLVRTGLALLAVPLAILALLVVTAGPDRIERALEVPLLAASAALLAVGGALLFRSLHSLARLEQRIAAMARRADL